MLSLAAHLVILSHSLEVLFTLTLCFLFVKYLFMYLRASVSNPYAPNLAINKSWFNVPKAFGRSMNIAEIYPLLSKTLFHTLMKLFETFLAFSCKKIYDLEAVFSLRHIMFAKSFLSSEISVCTLALWKRKTFLLMLQ